MKGQKLEVLGVKHHGDNWFLLKLSSGLSQALHGYGAEGWLWSARQCFHGQNRGETVLMVAVCKHGL